MSARSQQYRVVKHLAAGEPQVYVDNGRPFTKHSATKFARLAARGRADITRIEVQKVETIATIVPPALARAEAQADVERRMAS